MNLRIPVPRPAEATDGDARARGGVEEEELRRIEQRAGRYLADQAVETDAALARGDADRGAVLQHHQEALQARAIAARAQTLRAEGTTRLTVFFAAGAVVALVFGPFFFGSSDR